MSKCLQPGQYIYCTQAGFDALRRIVTQSLFFGNHDDVKIWFRSWSGACLGCTKFKTLTGAIAYLTLDEEN